MKIGNFLSISACALLVSFSFVGCSDSDSPSQVTNDVVVERGPVLNSKVADATGKIASQVGTTNTYRFVGNITYPLTATGGFIDVDGDGLFGAGDANLTGVLKTNKGSNITPLTTFVAQNDEVTVKATLGIDNLYELPSKDKKIYIASEVIFDQMVRDINISQIDIDLIENNITAINFTSNTQTPKDFAKEKEKEHFERLKRDTTLTKFVPYRALTRISSYDTNTTAGSEIVAFDKTSQRMFVTNGATKALDIIDMSDPKNPEKVSSIAIANYGADLQSVAVHNGKVAVAVGSANKVTTKGKVVVFDSVGELLSQTTVGYLPDMVTFNEDGTKVIVANEGEPIGALEEYEKESDENVTVVSGKGAYVDVAGSIGVITLASADTTDNSNGYAEVGFANATLSPASDTTPVRLGGTPSNAASLDIEPEYIAVSGDYAYVTLQENNALAKVNISGETPTLTFVKSFGAKSYTDGNSTIDIEEDGDMDMKNYPELYALYMPDTIASYKVNNTTYLVTANEGDGREYPTEDVTSGPETGDVLTDDKKISKLTLDDAIKSAYANDNDLKVIVDMGDADNDGDYEKLYTFGARSFSIWDTNGTLVWDSGDAISKKVAEFEPDLFNQDQEEEGDDKKDARSGNKGSEPEALAIGKLANGKTYVFVGLERQSAIVVYDISNPNAPTFVDYVITHRDGDVSPEGMKFIGASDSPSGKDLLLVANEVSGSTVIYEVK